ncbi:hypothetical protein ACOMHN_028103 [Nucella lapillus]
MLLPEAWNSSLTTGSSAEADERTENIPLLYTVSVYIWYLVSPAILLLGNFGNVMTIIIMQRMKSEESVINLYFMAFAVVDLVSLDIILFGEWVGMAFGYFIENQHPILCKIFNWMIVSTTISGWFLVGLTFHRAVSVVWPHRVNLLCTRRLAIVQIVGMTLFPSLAYSHYLYGYELNFSKETGDYSCELKSGRYLTFVNEIFTYIDMVLYSLLPFTCIICANGVLVWALRGTVRMARHNLAEKESVAAREKATFSVTRTVIVLCVRYVMLTLPASVDYIFGSFFLTAAEVPSPEEAKTYLSSLVMHMLMFSNNAVNFYLYCLTGKRFRVEFIRIFWYARHRCPAT